MKPKTYGHNDLSWCERLVSLGLWLVYIASTFFDFTVRENATRWPTFSQVLLFQLTSPWISKMLPWPWECIMMYYIYIIFPLTRAYFPKGPVWRSTIKHNHCGCIRSLVIFGSSAADKHRSKTKFSAEKSPCLGNVTIWLWLTVRHGKSTHF